MAVFSAACLIELVRAQADLVFEFELLRLDCHARRRFLWGIFIHGGNSFEGKRTLERMTGQFPKIGAVKGTCFSGRKKTPLVGGGF